MSASDQIAQATEVEDVDERHALAFRIAIAASVGFTLGELMGWDFPFLPSLIAVQLLSARRSLDLKGAFGFVLLMAVGCTISLFVSLIFADRPLSLILVVGLMIFIEFLALARGKAAAGIFLMTTSFVPLMAVSSLDLAYGLVHDLIVGSILALLLIFLILALFPQRVEQEQGSAQLVREGAPVAAALANTGVLMSLFVYFMGTGTPTSIIVIMVTAVTILQQSAVAGPGAAAGLIAGNIIGGLAATIAYLLISLLPSPAFLLLVVLFFGLAFGAKIAAGGKLASIAAVGTATFLVVLGLGLSPLPQDSGTLFLARISTVILASLYTIGISSVLRSLFSDQVSVTR
jgi:uncharacterized membrane protein YgaE (UPF0421/DUF939 family)